MKNSVLLFVLMLISLISKGQNDCSTALTAATTNTVPPTTNDYWYNYTMPIEGKLQISAPSTAYVVVYVNTCNAKFHRGEGSGNLTLTNINNGDNVLIKWLGYSGGDFTWNLSASAIEDGDICSEADDAASGTNALPATSSFEYWYTYTMPNDDNKLQITSTSDSDVELYTNTCNDLTLEAEGHENASISTLHSGDEVFIKWTTDNGGGFNWNLSVTPLAPGDACSVAATATTGSNNLPATANTHYWYTYTMPSDGKLQITSAVANEIEVYTNTCSELNLEKKRNGNVSLAPLSSGDQVFIKWNTDNGGDFTWDLSATPLSTGDLCSMATTAVAGTNTSPAAPHWSKYHVPATGDYTISSVTTATTNTYLKVYSDCTGSLLGEKDDYFSIQSQLTLSLTSGDDIYILWDDDKSSEGFDWILSNEDDLSGVNQTISFSTLPDKMLTDDPFELAATASSGLAVSYTSSNEAVATVSGSTVTIVGAGTTTITASQAGDDIHNAAPSVEQVLTVTKVSQTISVDAIDDQLVDASPITVNAATTSGLTLEYSVTGPATISDNIVTLNGTEGTVKVTVSQAGDDYYSAASASESFIVTNPSLQDQTIIFDVLPAKTVEDESFDLTATASSDLPVSYTSSDEGVATISGSTVTIVGAGTTTISAHQDGNDSYRTATPVEQVLTVTEPAPEQTEVDCTSLSASIQEIAHIACNGSANGSLTASASGGEAPYQYSMDGSTFQEAASFTDLASGDYTITVKDANGCTATVETKITAPEALVAVGQVSPSTEFPENGSIALSVSGGTAPYSYEWSNDATTATISDLIPGDFSVIVTDAAGCITMASFEVGGVTSIGELQQSEAAVYPNPAQDVLHIDLPTGGKAKSAALYNLLGKKVAEVPLSRGKNQLNTRALNPGTYLLKLDDGTHQRIVVK